MSLIPASSLSVISLSLSRALSDVKTMGAGAAVADAVSLLSVFSFRFLFWVRRFFGVLHQGFGIIPTSERTPPPCVGRVRFSEV
jgi:hypothetical protein